MEESEYNLSSINDKNTTIKSLTKNNLTSVSGGKVVKEYKGEFSKGKFHGKGKLVYDNKESYDGEFMNNLFNGKGSYYFNNGNIYQGDFKEGKLNGKGVMFFSNKQVSFTGDFVNNKPSGNGYFYDLNKNLKQSVIYDSGELVSLQAETAKTSLIFKNVIVPTPL